MEAIASGEVNYDGIQYTKILQTSIDSRSSSSFLFIKVILQIFLRRKTFRWTPSELKYLDSFLFTGDHKECII